ncbi:MAG TPA: NTP transferase domain-containing protein [Polyangiales bacterium]|nr:NTP transferase domain-containing protein [Polyangiales bacterium]
MLVMGICVGGRGRRMGGVQKALLRAPDTGETLIARLIRIGREAGHEVVLLGAADLGVESAGAPQLPDAAPDLGPLAGLQSLLRYADDRSALCVACDMPYVTAALLARLAAEPLLLEASSPHAAAKSDAADASAHSREGDAAAQPGEMRAHVLAPRDAKSGRWDALFARYESASVAPLLAHAWAEGERSFQGLFRRLTPRELMLDELERLQLRDWDTPEDMRAP